MDVSVLREKICNLTLFDDELMTIAFHEQCELTQILLDAICPDYCSMPKLKMKRISIAIVHSVTAVLEFKH